MTTTPLPAATHSPWPGTADRLVQALLASAVTVVLAAMLVNWLGVFLVVEGSARVTDAAVRTWVADAVALGLLGTAGTVHSLLRRGRPGHWPVVLLALVLPAVVVLAVPGLSML